MTIHLEVRDTPMLIEYNSFFWLCRQYLLRTSESDASGWTGEVLKLRPLWSQSALRKWTKEWFNNTEEFCLSATTSKAIKTAVSIMLKVRWETFLPFLGHKAFVDRMRRLSEVERKISSDFDAAVDRTAEKLSLDMREKKRPKTR